MLDPSTQLGTLGTEVQDSSLDFSIIAAKYPFDA